MERQHYHPLNASQICCPEHAYDLCSIYRRQSRHDEAINCLASLCDSVETKFLLDDDLNSVKLKRTLSLWSNRYAVQKVKLQDYSSALALLECAEMLLSNQTEDVDSVGLLSSTLVNKSMCLTYLGDTEGACSVLDRAAALDRQVRDTIGSLITRLNKSSMLYKLGAFHESCSTAKEVAAVLEPKVAAIMRGVSDADLQSSQKFIDLMSLFLIAQINVLTAMEVSGDKAAKDSEVVRAAAVALATRFFGDTHFLTVKLKRSAASAKRDFRIRTRRGNGRSWGSDSLDQVSLQDLAVKTSFEESKTFAWPTDHDASLTNLPSFIQDEPIKTSTNTAKKGLLRSNLSSRKGSVESQETPTQHSSKVIPTKKERLEPKETPIKRDSKTAPKLALAPLKVIRLPSSKLPQIPKRQCWDSFLKYVRQHKLELKDYSFLLDPNLGYVNVHADTQVSKLSTFGPDTYVVTCGVSVQFGKLFLVITAELVNSTNSYITPESIQFTELISIINYLAVRDVMPNDVPVKFINNFEKFSQYFLLPFIKITNLEDSSNQKKIELWSQPNSLLPPDTCRAFLDLTCRVSVYQITLKSLRLVLNDVADEENIDRNISCDLVLDDVAAELLLKEYEAQYTTPSCVQSLKPLNASFMKQIDPIITELELYVKDYLHLHSTFNQLLKSKLLFMSRATIEGKSFEKTLWTIMDLRKHQLWRIRAKSLAVSNSSGRRNRCEAVMNIPYTTLVQNYGIHIDLLETSERFVFGHYTLNSLRLERHLDDEASSAESVIVPALVVNVITKRSIKSADYKVPVTLSLIGQGSNLLGVKATLFDVQQSLELGCFFPIFGSLFKDKALLPAGKKKRRFELMDALLSQAVNGSNIAELLDNETGWGHLLNCVQIAGGKLFVRDLLGRKSYLDSLENVMLRYK